MSRGEKEGGRAFTHQGFNWYFTGYINGPLLELDSFLFTTSASIYYLYPSQIWHFKCWFSREKNPSPFGRLTQHNLPTLIWSCARLSRVHIHETNNFAWFWPNKQITFQNYCSRICLIQLSSVEKVISSMIQKKYTRNDKKELVNTRDIT